MEGFFFRYQARTQIANRLQKVKNSYFFEKGLSKLAILSLPYIEGYSPYQPTPGEPVVICRQILWCNPVLNSDYRWVGNFLGRRV